jgi:hypothetical protein
VRNSFIASEMMKCGVWDLFLDGQVGGWTAVSEFDGVVMCQLGCDRELSSGMDEEGKRGAQGSWDKCAIGLRMFLFHYCVILRA